MASHGMAWVWYGHEDGPCARGNPGAYFIFFRHQPHASAISFLFIYLFFLLCICIFFVFFFTLDSVHRFAYMCVNILEYNEYNV